jgi:hypothetical protein
MEVGRETNRLSMRVSSDSTVSIALGVLASMTCTKRSRPSARQKVEAIGGTHIVVIAVGAVLVRLFVGLHVLPKGLFALFAEERHLVRLDERVVGRLGVAFGALEAEQVSSGQSVWLHWKLSARTSNHFRQQGARMAAWALRMCCRPLHAQVSGWSRTPRVSVDLDYFAHELTRVFAEVAKQKRNAESS